MNERSKVFVELKIRALGHIEKGVIVGSVD